MSAEKVTVRCRELMMRWIFRELIENSFRHGGSTVTVQVGLEVDVPNRQAVLRVIDDGAGIDPGTLGRLFTMTDQPHGGSRGTGLGLVGVKSYLETMDGRINVENRERGLVTTVTLPLVAKGGTA